MLIKSYPDLIGPPIVFNHIKPNSSNYYTLPYRPNLPFLICDIFRMSESKYGRLGLYGVEHLKCNHTMTLGFKFKWFNSAASRDGSGKTHNDYVIQMDSGRKKKRRCNLSIFLNPPFPFPFPFPFIHSFASFPCLPNPFPEGFLSKSS